MLNPFQKIMRWSCVQPASFCLCILTHFLLFSLSEAWEVNGVISAGMQQDYHLTLTQRWQSTQNIRITHFLILAALPCLWGYNVCVEARHFARQRAGCGEEAGLEYHWVGWKWSPLHRCGKRRDTNGRGFFWAQGVSNQQPGHNAYRSYTVALQAETFAHGGQRQPFLPVWPTGSWTHLHISHLEEDEEHPAPSDGCLGSCQDGEYSWGALLWGHAIPH